MEAVSWWKMNLPEAWPVVTEACCNNRYNRLHCTGGRAQEISNCCSWSLMYQLTAIDCMNVVWVAKSCMVICFGQFFSNAVSLSRDHSEWCIWYPAVCLLLGLVEVLKLVCRSWKNIGTNMSCALSSDYHPRTSFMQQHRTYPSPKVKSVWAAITRQM